MKSSIEFIHVFYLAIIASMIFVSVCMVEYSFKNSRIIDHGDTYELLIAGQSLIYDKN